MNAQLKPTGFPLPSSLRVVPGTERAQAAYPYHIQFSPEDDQRFWFYNSMHFPEPMSAFDMVTAEAAYCALSKAAMASARSALNWRLAIWDLAAGMAVYDAAKAKGIGREIAL